MNSLKITLALVSFSTLGLGTAVNAQANDPVEFTTPSIPWCSQNYRASSYAFGLGTVFSMPWQVKASHFFDPGCYALGKSSGNEIRAQHALTITLCETAFKSGMEKGLEIENLQFNSRYADCEQAGYSFGEALLTESARAGTSTSACNLAYQQGYVDACEDRVPQAFGNRKKDFCYSIGFDDGAWFGR